MPRRLDNAKLRPELQRPEARDLALAVVSFMAGRVEVVSACRRRGVNLTLMDLVITMHVFAWRDHGGTRQIELINSMDAPRATIRSSLERLERNGVICRSPKGLYFPTDLVADVADEAMSAAVRDLSRVFRAFQAYTKVICNSGANIALLHLASSGLPVA